MKTYGLQELESMWTIFKRSGTIVDMETQEHIIKQKITLLTPQQRIIMTRCRNLFNTNIQSWKEVATESFLVRMYAANQVKNNCHVNFIRVSAIIDTTVDSIAAWLWDFNSNEHQYSEKQRNDLLFMEHTRSYTNEQQICFATRMPWPIRCREFNLTMIKDKIGSKIEIAIETNSVPSSYKYNNDIKVVNGKLRGYFLIEPQTDSQLQCDTIQSKINYIQYCDPRGHIPFELMNKKFNTFPNFVVGCTNTFCKSKRIDSYREKIDIQVFDKPQYYDANENEIFTEISSIFQNIDTYENSQHSTVDVDVEYSSGPTRQTSYRMTSIIDAYPTKIASWLLASDNRAQLLNFVNHNGRNYVLEQQNEHKLHSYWIMDSHALGFRSRKFSSVIIWKLINGGRQIMIVKQDIDNNSSSENDTEKYVCGSMKQMVLLEFMPPDLCDKHHKCSKTKITSYFQVDSHASIIHHSTVDDIIKRESNLLSICKNHFDQNVLYDNYKIKDYALTLTSFPQINIVHSSSEKRMIGTAVSIIQKLKVNEKYVSGIVSKSIDISNHHGQKTNWSKNEIMIHGHKEDIISYFWNVSAKCRYNTYDTFRKVIHIENDYHQIIHTRTLFKYSIFGRKYTVNIDRIARTLCAHLNNTTYVYISIPTEFESTSSQYKRINISEIVIVSEIEPNKCKLSYLFHHQPDKSNPFDKIVYSIYYNSIISYYTNYVFYTASFFLRNSKLDSIDSFQCQCIARVLVAKISNIEPNVDKLDVISSFLNKHLALRELVDKYPWLPVMIDAITDMKLTLSVAVNSKLECITERDAENIGKSLAIAIRSRKTVSAAVDQWRLAYPSMRQLIDTYPWLTDLFTTLSLHVSKTARWGIIQRVGMGAFLCIFDTITDVYMINEYYRSQKYIFANSLIIMVLLNITTQLATVYIQHRKLPFKMLCKEALPALFGLKSSYGAYQIITGNVHREHHTFDALTELCISRVIETVTESIPSGILQLYVFLMSTEKTNSALFSIIISCMATSWISTTIGFDIDTDPDKRKNCPEFYGYIPDLGHQRQFVFGIMFINSLAQVMMRSLSVVLLIMVKFNWFIQFLSFDMSLFILYKILQNDFYTWIPLKGLILYVFSLLMRIMSKLITDFTGLHQSRHPFDMGGAYWSINQMFTQIIIWGSLYLFDKYSTIEQISLIRPLWIFIGSINFVWCMSIAAFLYYIGGKYRKTFFSSVTGRQHAIDTFIHGHTDANKSHIFLYNEHLWYSIRREVKEWCHTNWEEWCEEKPEWFTQTIIAKIPKDFIPVCRNIVGQSSNIRNIRRTILDFGGSSSLTINQIMTDDNV